MAIAFLSEEWAGALKDAINASDAYRAAASDWEGDFYFIADMKDKSTRAIYLDLWHGKCRQAEFLADPSSKSPEFQITADMEKWKKVLAGKLDPVQGMVTRQIKLDGNLVKIMKNVKAAQELVRCATKVPTVY